MINFLEISRTVNFFDKKIMKFILENNNFRDCKNFLCSIIDLKNKTNQFNNHDIINIINDFMNLNIDYHIINEKIEYSGNFYIISSYKIINHEKLEIIFSTDFINTFNKQHYLSEIDINIFFSFSLFSSIHLYNFLVSRLSDFSYTKIEIEKLKEILHVKNNYKRIYDFEKYILHPALKEINRVSHVKFFYNKIKKSNKKNAKVVGFDFFQLTEDKFEKINNILNNFNVIENYDILFNSIIYGMNSISYDDLLNVVKNMKALWENRDKDNKITFEMYFINNMKDILLNYKNQYTLVTNISKIDSFNQYKSLIFENSYSINTSFLFMWNDISTIKRNQFFEYEDDILKIKSYYFDDGERNIKIYKKD